MDCEYNKILFFGETAYPRTDRKSGRHDRLGGIVDVDRKYQFSWGLLGDLESGRPNLGKDTRLEIYRLMQFSFRDVMEQHFGAEKTDRIFYEAGKLSGMEFCENILGGITDLPTFLSELQRVFREMAIGILRIEQSDPVRGSFVFTVSEDLECSGLPELDYEICVYDEGFIAGLLERFSGKRFEVKEVDCWCTGDRTCRFIATMLDAEAQVSTSP